MLSPAEISQTVELEAAIEVLLVGAWDTVEFADLLPTITASSYWHRASNCAQADELLTEGELAPELILLADPLPDTFSSEDVESLLLAAPLARLVVVAGSWCEGELRTGTPLTEVLRLYWYELPGWWAAASQALAEGGCPPWSHPMDGPLAGRIVSGGQAVLTGAVAIDCKSITTFEAISNALSPYGADCHWTPRGELGQLPSMVTAGIWDGGQLEPLEVERMQTFSQAIRASGGIVVTLVDFPRREHLEIARNAGCHAVFGKPYVVNELVSRIAALSYSRR